MKRKRQKSKRKLWQYLQDYRFNSILVKSFLIILAYLVITFTIIMAAVSRQMNDIIVDEVGTMNENALEKTRDRIDAVMEEVERISGKLALDSDVRRFMLPGSGEYFGNNQTLNVQRKIAMYSGVFDYIDSIYVYSHKNKFVVSNEDAQKLEHFPDTNWTGNLLEREYEPARMISRVKEDSYPNLISYLQPIRLTQMQFLGGIIVNVDNDRLAELIVAESRESNERLIIADNRSNIIYSSDNALLRRKLSDIEGYKKSSYDRPDGWQIIEENGAEQIMTIASSDSFQWNYISQVPMSAYADHKNSIFLFRTVLYVISLLLSFAAAFVISLYSYKPVRNILDLLKNPDLYHEHLAESDGFKHDETHEINLNILRNLYSNRQMKADLAKYTDIIDKAQLTALQAQISPHFLYNTLENIRWRAMELEDGGHEVSDSIFYLSEMLRNSLDTDQQIISLDEEVQNAGIYIKILQLRYGDKIQVIWDIEPQLGRYAIVKVSLQPLIENAVYHGIKPLRTGGQITIRGDQDSGRLVITVSDNGIGMAPETVASLNEDMQEKYTLREDNIGIRNVNQRIRLLLGDEAAVRISSVAGSGTTVMLILPLRLYGEEVRT